jgi:hypothetical protein
MRIHVLALLLALASGCLPARTITVVTGRIEPRQIHFATVVEQSEKDEEEEEPSGWRAACIHLNITRQNTGESFLCRFGVEVPMRTKKGPVSLPLAQRITAERIDEAAQSVFRAATPDSPLGLLCESLKATVTRLLDASLKGSRVKTRCHEKTVPVQLGESIP